MNAGFDLISDLNLTSDDDFDWTGKPTSLYCIVAGNISNDIAVVTTVLSHLSTVYHGVFYIDGALEHDTLTHHHKKVNEISKICRIHKNTVYLHNNVVVVDGVALVGSNGWFGNYMPKDDIDDIRQEMLYHEDLSYICTTVEKLQLHPDVKKIIMITNSVPAIELFYGELPPKVDDIGPSIAIIHDTEHKISHWVFGSHKKIVDTTIGNINYINNASHRSGLYWPRRVEVSI